MILEVNEFSKRRVSWQHYRGDMKVGKWVAREDNSTQAIIKGRDNGPAEPHALWLGKVKGCSGPLLTSCLSLRLVLAPSRPKLNPAQVLQAQLLIMGF